MNELIEALTRFLNEATRYLARQNGGPEEKLTPAPEAALPPAKPPRTKKSTSPSLPSKEQVAAIKTDDLFPPTKPISNGKATAEEVVEAKRRGIEVMGLFIRKHKNATPPGLDRLKTMLAEITGRPVGKLDELTHEDNVKLIPVFEAELDEAK